MLPPALPIRFLCAACCRAARLIRASHDLQLDTGLLLAVPIPTSAAAEGAAIQQAIQESLREADAQGVAGAEVSLHVIGLQDSLLRQTHCVQQQQQCRRSC
jgi:pseudouridine-5'-phosphate glycosidase